MLLKEKFIKEEHQITVEKETFRKQKPIKLEQQLLLVKAKGRDKET